MLIVSFAQPLTHTYTKARPAPMGLLTAWLYPLQGIVYLTSCPQLLRVVLKFLMVVTAASLITSAAWVHIFWGWHLALVAKAFGINLFSKFVTLLVLLTESALPVYLVFDHRFEKMQQQLFDATLELRGVSVSGLQPQDRETLQKLMAQKQQQDLSAAVHSSKRTLLASTASSCLSLLVRILLKPQPKESVLVRKARDVATLGVSVFLPLLLPLVVYRDSSAEAASLMSRYWQLKGVTSCEAQALVVGQRPGECRSFGLVAAGLNYIPLLNWFLGLSNMVGAALYAADLEKKGAPLFSRR